MRRMSFNNLFLTSMSVFLLITQPNIYAQVDTFEFDNDEQQGRFRQLSNELRCPMCQNTNLSGSTGGVAEDLRREIHRMILEGMSNEKSSNLCLKGTVTLYFTDRVCEQRRFFSGSDHSYF